MEKRCLENVLSIKQMQKVRETFCQNHPTYNSQRQFILNWLNSNQLTKGEFSFYISGLQVCCNAFIKVLGVTERRFFGLKRDYLNGRRSGINGEFFASKESP